MDHEGLKPRGSSPKPNGTVVGTCLSSTPRESNAPSLPSHVDLGPAFYDWYSWSNAVEDLDLDTYFDPSKQMNLGNGFGLEGLQPVIREKGGDTFLLKAGKSCYMWDIWWNQMFKWINGDGVEPMDAALRMVEGLGESEDEWIDVWAI